MARAIELPRAVAAFGARVDVNPAFLTLGSDSFAPEVVVGHHTASAPPANLPALGTILGGRPDLAPPLANGMVARDGLVVCTASGRANHAGPGSWRGMVGNTFALGWEVENNGTGEMWTSTLIMSGYVPAVAGSLAMLGRDASWFCRHAEWAGPRKIDPWGPWWDGHRWEQDADHFRELVQITLNTGGLDMDTLGIWMQQQSSRVIAALTAVVNGRRSDSLFLVKPASRAARPTGTWVFDGTERRQVDPETARLWRDQFHARVVILSPAQMTVWKAAVPVASVT